VIPTRRLSSSLKTHRANLVPPGQVHAQFAAVGVLRLASNRFVGGPHRRRVHHGTAFVTRCPDVETALAREVMTAVAEVLANALAVAFRVALVAGSGPDVRIVAHRPLVVALGAPDRVAMGRRLRRGWCRMLASWRTLVCWGCALRTRGHAEGNYISHAHAVRPETRLGTKHASVSREQPSVGGVARTFRRHVYKLLAVNIIWH
jgi:hypothetical protein